MSGASEKAADRMHADLAAMVHDCDRHAQKQPGGGDGSYAREQYWIAAKAKVAAARDAIVKCMSERDRRLVQ